MTGSSGFAHSHGLDLGVGAPGFAQGVHSALHFGHGHVAGEVTFDAIVVGYSFPEVSAHPSAGGHVDTHDGFSIPAGTMEGNGPSFDVPLDSGRTNFGLLVVGCGILDWETKARKELAKQVLAECFNLQPPTGLVSPPRRFDRILPVNYKAGAKLTNPVWPAGMYKGATGSTTISRTNWEVGDLPAFGAMLGNLPKRKVGCRTYLEVEITVWHFAEADDYEVRIVVRVIGGNDPGELRDATTAARGFCKGMFKVLKATPPSSDAKRFRDQLAAGKK